MNELTRQLDLLLRGSVEIIQQTELESKVTRSLKERRPLRVKAGFDPTAPEPDGTWGNYSQNVAGVYRRTRSDNARYWHWKDA